MQSGKPVGVFQTHAGAPRVLIANALLVPAWATWETFRELEAPRPDDVRPDDGRQLDLHRQRRASCRAPTKRSPRSARRHFGGSLAGQARGHRRARRHGRRPAARRHHERRRRAGRRSRSAAHRAAPRDALPRRSDRQTWTRRSTRVRGWTRDGVARSIGAARQRRRRAAGAGRPRRHARRADRPDLRARCAERLRARTACRSTKPRGCASATRRVHRAVDGGDGRARARDAARCRQRGAVTFDYGNNIRAQARQAGVADAFDIPGFVPEYIRPLFCEGKGPFRWVALSGDPDDIRVTDDAALEMFADDAVAGRWIRAGARARRVPGAAGAHLLARLRRARAVRAAHQRAGARGRDQGADRDRPRSPRHRIGGLAEPRDRRHARRQRRDRRLADPERAAQRVERRHLGVGAPRRRRRHRLLAPRRHGDRRRRHAPTPTRGSSAC